MRPAFVIIDMQKQFTSQIALDSPTTQHACALINHVSILFRQHGKPVIFILDMEDCPPDAPDFAIVEPLDQDQTDLTIHKIQANSFRETQLEQIVREQGIDFLIFAGFKAEGCVLSTLHGATDRDLRHAILKDAVISPSKTCVDFLHENFPVLSYQVVEAILS